MCIQSIGEVGRVSVSAENLEWPFKKLIKTQSVMKLLSKSAILPTLGEKGKVIYGSSKKNSCKGKWRHTN